MPATNHSNSRKLHYWKHLLIYQIRLAAFSSPRSAASFLEQRLVIEFIIKVSQPTKECSGILRAFSLRGIFVYLRPWPGVWSRKSFGMADDTSSENLGVFHLQKISENFYCSFTGPSLSLHWPNGQMPFSKLFCYFLEHVFLRRLLSVMWLSEKSDICILPSF